MKLLQDWTEKKLLEVARKLPSMIHNEPASFSCGHNVGYKQALIDLINFLEEHNLYDTSEENKR